MRTSHPKLPYAFTFLALGLLIQAPVLTPAQDHVVPSAELRDATVRQARARKENLSKVEKFFSNPRVRKAVKSAHLDPVRIQKAVPALSDQELARLASQSEKVQKDFAAGALTSEQLTYAVIALAAAVIVIIVT